jgi:ABC-2 type transport system permease protein
MTFWKLVRLAVRQQMAYRTAMYAGLVTNLFFGFLRVAVMLALYKGRNEVNQMTVFDSITYVGLTQALIAFLNIFGTTDIMQTIYSGQIGSDLLKPIHFMKYWMARSMGTSFVNLVGRGVFFMLIFGIFYPLKHPSSWSQWLALLLVLFLAWMMGFAWRFLVNLAGFWSPDGRGIARIAYTLSGLFSGFIMPLRLLPDWFSRICSFTPFPSMVNTPVEVYLGLLAGGDLFIAIMMQAIWMAVLFGLATLFLRGGLRRLVIQGG